VRRHYAGRALAVLGSGSASVKEGSCCGSGLYAAEDLRQLPEDAVAASAGCGNPLLMADLRPGETVLDLGSGGGIDVLLSTRRVGPSGKAYGLDMTDEMLSLARENLRRAGVRNAELLKGWIERIPLPDESVDVLLSNCVVNLSPDKDAVFSEAYRVLRPRGRLAIADIVLEGEPDPELANDARAWAECLGGAISREQYSEGLAEAGFEGITIEESHRPVPGFVSALVRAVKPGRT
jgi:SAM-dependent methyltransferase